MSKRSKYPKLRVSRKKGKAGQTWISFWYDMRGRGKPDIALGNNYEAALLKWQQIHGDEPRQAGTLEEAFARWGDEVLPEYESRTTRNDYSKCLRHLRPVFGPAMWSAVTLPVLKSYLKKRTAKTRANREISTLQVVWNWARTEGLTSLPWPAAGMERSKWKNKEHAREVDVTDAAFAAIYSAADQVLKDAMDLASATGMRVYDVLGLRLSDVRGGSLHNRASKTNKRAEYALAGSAVIPPIIERRIKAKSLHVFLLDAGGRVVTYRMLYDRFKAARAIAAKQVPECAGLVLRDFRKRAAQLSGSLAEASELLQHSSTAVTRKHYRGGDKLRPVR